MRIEVARGGGFGMTGADGHGFNAYTCNQLQGYVCVAT